MKKLSIEESTNVTDYLNQKRRFKSDLKSVGYTLTNDMFATSVLEGLDNKQWSFFKQK